MKIYKVVVTAGSTIWKCDGIEWQGKLWLVPRWLDDKSKGATTPARIIRFDNLPHADVRGSNIGDYVIHDPIPKELFEIETPKQPIIGFEYIDLPALQNHPGKPTN